MSISTESTWSFRPLREMMCCFSSCDKLTCPNLDSTRSLIRSSISLQSSWMSTSMVFLSASTSVAAFFRSVLILSDRDRDLLFHTSNYDFRVELPVEERGIERGETVTVVLNSGPDVLLRRQLCCVVPAQKGLNFSHSLGLPRGCDLQRSQRLFVDVHLQHQFICCGWASVNKHLAWSSLASLSSCFLHRSLVSKKRSSSSLTGTFTFVEILSVRVGFSPVKAFCKLE